MTQRKDGFTLVELSIVLVILGLLVGGVLSGQSLIRASELRAVATEFNGFQTALGAFKDKYFALPGDMNNAVKYWGAQAGATTDGVDSTCSALTTAATGVATCNGNGNGLVWKEQPTADAGHEAFRAWQHLANAGLVAGTFSGITGPGSIVNTVPGTNTPRSKLSTASWLLWGLGTTSSYTNYFDGNYGNSFMFGAQAGNYSNYNPVMKAEEAYNIDMKMDDGKPHQGIVRTMKYAAMPNCVVSANNAYALDNQTVGCMLVMISGY